LKFTVYFCGGDENMKKHAVVFSLLCLSTIFCTAVGATIVEFPLSSPFQYEREIGPIQVQHDSPVDIYVANVYAPERWKDWKIVIWVPIDAPDVTMMQVDYSNDPLHIAELERFDVSLAAYTEPFIPGWKGFYADTFLVGSQWEQFGTNPVGSGPHAWGNPAWVSFHFDVNVDPYIYIKDACIPEPMTIMLLGLGALALRRRK
jgi:hypothetical protein